MVLSNVIKFFVLGLVLMTGIFFSLAFGGSTKLGIQNISSDDFIFMDIRLPKTLTAVIAGACLGVSGLILQVLFRNPLAGPFVLGISSGAALMVALGLLAGQTLHLHEHLVAGRSLTVFMAVSGSLLVTFMILYIARKVQSNVILLLIGLMFSQICGAIQSSIEYFADPAALKLFVIWGMGSLSGTTLKDVALMLPAVLLSLVFLLAFMKPLNALLLGEAYARNLGIDFKRNRFYLLLFSSFLTGLCTAFCGPIAFIGTAVPILSRIVFSTSRQEVHFIACVMLGAIILLFADFICHTALEGVSLPVNMITTLIGAPLVIYLMFKNKKW